MKNTMPCVIKLGNPMTEEETRNFIKELLKKRAKATSDKEIENCNELLTMAYDRLYGNL